MRTKELVDLSVSLFLLECKSDETDKYVDLVRDETGFVWFSFDDRELEQMIGYVVKAKSDRYPIAICDVYKFENIVSALKRRCTNYRRRGM